MRRLLQRTDELLLQVSVLFSAGLLVCVLLQVFFRYVLLVALPWSEELTRYLFIWSSMLAAAVVVGQRDHFSIPIVIELFPPRVRRLLDILGTVLCIAFAVLVVVKGTAWSWRMLSARSPVLEFPQGGVYAVMPLAALYMIAHLAVHLTTLLGACRGKEGQPC
jgi:TRAP-type C4-dicarboxylate transport system permease small subunit